MADNQIGLEAIFDALAFSLGAEDYNKTLEKLSSVTEVTGRAMSDTWTGLAEVGAVAFDAIGIAVKAGIAAVGAGIAAMSAELIFASKAAMESQDAQAELAAVLQSTKGAAGVTAESINQFAAAMQKTTRFEDDAIIKGQSMLLTFTKIGKDVFPEASTAMLNLAQKFGSMDSAATQLGKALNDPVQGISALSRVGVTFSDEQKKLIEGFVETGDIASAQRVILKELETEFGGLAEAMGNTASGKLEILKNSFGDLQEALGDPLLDAMSDVLDRLIEFTQNPKVISFFSEVGKRIGAFASAVLDRLPSIMSVFDDVFSWFESNTTIASFFADIGARIKSFTDTVLTNMPPISTVLDNIVSWFQENKPLIVGILAAIGIAMIAFAATSISAAVSAAAAFAPVIAVMAVVGAAAALFFKAWTEDWGGIRTAIQKAWTQVKPVFEKLQAWVAENLPKAIDYLSKLWENTLLPAIKNVFKWIADNVIPVLVDVVLWLGDNVPKAIKAVSAFWTGTLLPAIKSVYDYINGTLIPGFMKVVNVITGVVTTAITGLSSIWQNVLLPAITAVWNFTNNYIIPLFNAVANVVNAVLGLAIRTLAGLWQNVLYPALSTVYSFISSYITPVFNTVANIANNVLGAAIRTLAGIWSNTLLPAVTGVRDVLEPFSSFLSNVLKKAFEGIRDAIGWVIDKLNKLADGINNLSLPDWLTPGSPTPFEIGLKGINAEMSKLTGASLPTLKMQLEAVRDVASGGSSRQVISNSISDSSQRTVNYLYGANFTVSGQSGMIEALQGL